SPHSAIRNSLAFDQPHVARARPFLRFLRSELHPLTFAQQLEHRSADRAAMEKVFDSTLVADEPEPFVDQEACDCPGWHNPKPSRSDPPGISQGNSAGYGRLPLHLPYGRGPAESCSNSDELEIRASLGSSRHEV